MQISNPEQTSPAGNSGLNVGVLDNRNLLAGRDGSLNNYSLHVSRSVTEYRIPRHRHNFEEVRFAVEGTDMFDGKMLPEGGVIYFPEGVHYGPQVRQEGSLILTAQFGGASGNGYISKRQQAAAREALLRTGRFEKGKYVRPAEGGETLVEQDAFEAMWEYTAGRKMIYPAPRYDELVYLYPDRFDWVEDPSAPGVAYKDLGRFTERETRIGFVRLMAGTRLPADPHPAPDLLFLAKGSLRHDRRVWPRYTALGLEPNEIPAIEAVETCEFFRIRLPKFG